MCERRRRGTKPRGAGFVPGYSQIGSPIDNRRECRPSGAQVTVDRLPSASALGSRLAAGPPALSFSSDRRTRNLKLETLKLQPEIETLKPRNLELATRNLKLAT